jgi:hypothetical protein
VKGEEAANTDLGGKVAVVSLLTGEEEDAKREAVKLRQVCGHYLPPVFFITL